MPQYGGFEPGDWLTIISIVIGLAIQSFAFFKWQTAQFKQRDDMIDAETEERHRQIELVKERTVANRDMIVRESARLDRENASTRHELAIAISNLPTRDYIEAMFRERFKPLEDDMRALVLELARNGLPVPEKMKK
jgi:hypothetical protein